MVFPNGTKSPAAGAASGTNTFEVSKSGLGPSVNKARESTSESAGIATDRSKPESNVSKPSVARTASHEGNVVNKLAQKFAPGGPPRKQPIAPATGSRSNNSPVTERNGAAAPNEKKDSSAGSA